MSKNPWIMENVKDGLELKQRTVNTLRCIENYLGDLGANLDGWLAKPKRKTDRQLAHELALNTQFLFRMMAGLECDLLKPHSEWVYEEKEET